MIKMRSYSPIQLSSSQLTYSMNRPNADQDCYYDTLPESKENYKLDAEKLSDGLVGRQFFF